jgi:hypothetical protein
MWLAERVWEQPLAASLAPQGIDFVVVDEWLGVKTVFRFSVPAVLWRFPVETVSLSESGFERLYQSSVVFPHWRMRLEQAVHLQVTQSVRALQRTLGT